MLLTDSLLREGGAGGSVPTKKNAFRADLAQDAVPEAVIHFQTLAREIIFNSPGNTAGRPCLEQGRGMGVWWLPPWTYSCLEPECANLRCWSSSPKALFAALPVSAVQNTWTGDSRLVDTMGRQDKLRLLSRYPKLVSISYLLKYCACATLPSLPALCSRLF